MALPNVKLTVTRPHRSEICNLAVARHIPGGYDILLGQDFQSSSKLQQSRGQNPPDHSLGTSKPQTPVFVPLPVPPECNVQWSPPSRSIPDPIPAPDPAPVPVPGPPIDPPPGDPMLDSQSLPVSLGCTQQCQAPSILNNEHILNQILVPHPALVPAPEHAADLHSRDSSPGPLSFTGLTLLPVPVRDMDPSDHSKSSPKGAASQPMPELVSLTCEPLTPPMTASALSQSAADTIVSKDSAVTQLADKLKELRACKEGPASAKKEVDTDSTQIPFPGSVPPISRPRQTIKVREVRGENTTGDLPTILAASDNGKRRSQNKKRKLTPPAIANPPRGLSGCHVVYIENVMKTDFCPIYLDAEA
ncbi:zyxin-like [Macrobrachium rosenbergii]|uniref:zyxin-like n=1 Tax=Macrobrachium rosenbergii TaxID=79674 RepID=UPI0034D71A74